MKASLYRAYEKEHYQWMFGEGNGRTEDAADIEDDTMERRKLRNRRLSFIWEGYTGTQSIGYRSAKTLVDMELIWLVGLSSVVQAHPYILAISFTYALTDPAYNSDGTGMDWYNYEQLAKKAGIDYQIEAYEAGVPLEYILSDCEIDQDCTLTRWYWDWD